jgi:hypothetical protein
MEEKGLLVYTQIPWNVTAIIRGKYLLNVDKRGGSFWVGNIMAQLEGNRRRCANCS